MTSADPTVRGEEPGCALRELRENARLSLADVAARIDSSVTTISRMENGRRTAATEDVSAMPAIYGITDQQRTQLLDLAREVDMRGWWQHDRPPSHSGSRP